MRKSRSKSPAPTGPPPGLRSIVQNRFLKDVFQGAVDKSPGWKVCVVDAHAMRVISSAIGMYDIMERKVMLVESLEKKRAPFPDMDAIYILEPSQLSIVRLIEDWSNKSNLLYGNNVFLYFLGRLPDTLFNEIKSCTTLLRRLKCLTEINIDFLTKEERVFTFDMREDFTSFYLRTSNSPSELMIADKLVTVCGTLNEYPHIRYKESSALGTSLASVFHSKMTDFITQNTSWWYHGGPAKGGQVSQRERATLLILDRSDDCLTPLMHEYTYQCLVHDLLKMEDDKITYVEDAPTESGGTKKQPKDVLLDEKDTIWTELRGKHVAEVSQILSARIREIMNSSTGNVLNKNNGGNLSMAEMSAALKALPEYQEVLSKLGQHLNMSLECLDFFTKRSLKDIAELEQTMATGQNEDLRNMKLADIIDAIETALMKIDNTADRLRLLLVATVALRGLRNQDRRRLLNCAELSREEMKCIDSLEIFGLPLYNDDEKNRPLIPYHPKAIADDDPDSDFQGSRYNPVLKSILEDVCNKTLSINEYPSVLPMPEEAYTQPSTGKATATGRKGKGAGSGVASSVRKSNAGATSRWSTPGASATTSKKQQGGPLYLSGPRIIVFIIGGASYSELRVCRDITEQQGREVIIGSTALLSAQDFINDLTKLQLQSQA